MATLYLTLDHEPPDRKDALARLELPANIAPPAERLESWQDLITWLTNNPDAIAMIIAALLKLLGGGGPQRKQP